MNKKGSILCTTLLLTSAMAFADTGSQSNDTNTNGQNATTSPSPDTNGTTSTSAPSPDTMEQRLLLRPLLTPMAQRLPLPLLLIIQMVKELPTQILTNPAATRVPQTWM
ncbi:hypothetical protein [Legionella longbeachae]|uniref:hypothetical protein n=1 Tax=Legionella longbeachae TaxID=450 RepID=UPI0001BEC38D|nr:hypothetical protein [Legionella longbeachae]EEZ93381.1 putative surface protein [Legionella longbeachae D-4968]